MHGDGKKGIILQGHTNDDYEIGLIVRYFYKY